MARASLLLRLAITLAAAAFAGLPGPLGASPAPYQLYYSFELPRALEGTVLDENGRAQKLYSGLIRGALGGLPLRDGVYTVGPVSSSGTGGGSCGLATAAGAIHGQILMTTDGKQTTLICAGTYLGTHIELAIRAEGVPIGGIGVTASGLALTGLRSHSEYMAAVRAAVTSLPEDARSRAIDQAEANPRLVSAYEQKTAPR